MIEKKNDKEEEESTGANERIREEEETPPSVYNRNGGDVRTHYHRWFVYEPLVMTTITIHYRHPLWNKRRW